MFTSAKDLIARKTDIDKRVNEELIVKIEEMGEWRFKMPTAEDIVDAQTYARTHARASDDSVADSYLVYNQCIEPDLHDGELQEAYGVRGYEILAKLLKAGEVDELAKALMQKAGYRGGCIEIIAKGAEEVKNA